MHDNIVEFTVYGDYALFSDPITRAGGEKCSYQVPTYEALKGVLHSVYWKPTLLWVIDSVRVMNQIQMESKGIRPVKYTGRNDLSLYTYLKDCRYQVRAHFIWNENRPELAGDRNENKHHNYARRMIQKGGRRDVFLGCRECQAYVEPCRFGEGAGYYDEVDTLSFGLMYHGMTYADEAYSDETKDRMSIRLWYPVMKKGVIDFAPPTAFQSGEERLITRPVRKMKIKPFGGRHGNFTGAADREEAE